MTSGYIVADVAIKTAYFSLVAAAFIFVSMLLLAGVHPLRLSEDAAASAAQGSKPGTDSDLLFVTGVLVLGDFKPVRVCEPWSSADCALPRGGNRQALRE